MANGSGTNQKAKASYAPGEYCFTMDSSITTSEGTALLKGGAECGDAYLTLAGTTIIVEAAGSVGDHLEFICDGTYWYVSGHGAHDASFSVS